MLPSNTKIPEVDNAPSWYPCQPVPGLYTTVLYMGFVTFTTTHDPYHVIITS